MDELEGHLLKAIEKFKGKIATDEALKTELADITRNININTTDNDGFSFILEKGEIKHFKRGKLEAAEITLHATTADFKLLFTGELKPMKAWATKRLKFDATIDDVMRLKKLIS
jgi:putative sterol carrier protein